MRYTKCLVLTEIHLAVAVEYMTVMDLIKQALKERG